jgi:hypothetical protein
MRVEHRHRAAARIPAPDRGASKTYALHAQVAWGNAIEDGQC